MVSSSRSRLRRRDYATQGGGRDGELRTHRRVRLPGGSSSTSPANARHFSDEVAGQRRARSSATGPRHHRRHRRRSMATPRMSRNSAAVATHFPRPTLQDAPSATSSPPGRHAAARPTRGRPPGHRTRRSAVADANTFTLTTNRHVQPHRADGRGSSTTSRRQPAHRVGPYYGGRCRTRRDLALTTAAVLHRPVLRRSSS